MLSFKSMIINFEIILFLNFLINGKNKISMTINFEIIRFLNFLINGKNKINKFEIYVERFLTCNYINL